MPMRVPMRMATRAAPRAPPHLRAQAIMRTTFHIFFGTVFFGMLHGFVFLPVLLNLAKPCLGGSGGGGGKGAGCGRAPL